jgi:hypothetical protein
MPKPNYAFEKRQRELEKKRKKEEKAERKKHRGEGGTGPEGEAPQDQAAEGTQPGSAPPAVPR